MKNRREIKKRKVQQIDTKKQEVKGGKERQKEKTNGVETLKTLLSRKIVPQTKKTAVKIV